MVYLNRSSPNQDLAKEFIERYLLTEDGLAAMDLVKPIGVPALISSYEKMAKNNPHLRQLKASVDYGQVMPNVPQMGRFFTSLGAALQLAADGRLSADAALRQSGVELVALAGGFRESAQSWADLLRDCARRGMRAPGRRTAAHRRTTR